MPVQGAQVIGKY